MSTRKELDWLRKSQQVDLTSFASDEKDKNDLVFFDGVLVNKKRATYAARDGTEGEFLASTGTAPTDDDDDASLSSSADEYESAEEDEISKEVKLQGKAAKFQGMKAGTHPMSMESSYGQPKSPDEIKEMIGPNEEGGIIWRAHILPNDFDANGEVRFLRERDYDFKKKCIKPRRGVFPITEQDLFSSLVKIEGTATKTTTTTTSKKGARAEEDDSDSDDDGDFEIFAKDKDAALKKLSMPLSSMGISSSSSNAPDLREDESSPRWVFSGVLNGWPGLTCLELRKIEVREVRNMQHGWTTHWSAKQHAPKDIAPTFPDIKKYTSGKKRITGGILKAFAGKKKNVSVGDVRATFRSPSWASRGWSKESPGFLFWYEGMSKVPRMTYGTNIALASSKEDYDECKDAHCERVHMVNHRYAVGDKETAKDRLTYHSFVFLEWDHGKYGTIVEIGYLNGIGGYSGKCNWFHDKDDKENGTAVYRALPPEMVKPWKEVMSEIRCWDVEASNLDEIMAYIKQYTGPTKRFVDPQCSFSHDVRLTYRSRRNIATYLLNYIRRDRTYNELKRNCQTFAADLCGFLAGKDDVAPFHPVNKIQYHNRMHFFLYESSKYKQSDIEKSARE